METQINRLKEAIEKLNHDCESLRVKEGGAQDQARKLQRQLRDLKEDYATITQKEIEVNAKKNEFEKLLELAEAETVTAKNDLKLALKRSRELRILTKWLHFRITWIGINLVKISLSSRDCYFATEANSLSLG